MTVQAVRALVEPTRLVALPPITEDTARRDVRIAQRAVTRARRKRDATPSGYSRFTRGYSPQWIAAESNLARAVQRLRAAENRLDAVLSQQPDRHIGGRAA